MTTQTAGFSEAASPELFTDAEQLTGAVITDMAEDAAGRLEGLATVTPVFHSAWLSEGQAEVMVKDETLQDGRSFKDRGAGNEVAFWSEQGQTSFVTSSAGNHGIGTARATGQRRVGLTAVLPETANEAKRKAIGWYKHANLVNYGQNFDEALEHGLELAEESGAQFVHPFASPLVIAGQATMGLELAEQVPDMTHLVLPVGGGGLLAGVGSAVKERLKDVQVIAVQVEGCDAFARSLNEGEPVHAADVDTSFEGVAVRRTHPLTLGIARKVVDRVMVVDKNSVFRAIYGYDKEGRETGPTRRFPEAAGGVGAAGASLLAEELKDTGAKIVVPVTGANVSPLTKKYVEARARRFGWAGARQFGW